VVIPQATRSNHLPQQRLILQTALVYSDGYALFFWRRIDGWIHRQLRVLIKRHSDPDPKVGLGLNVQARKLCCKVNPFEICSFC
jgi:hypothetical protein